MVNTTKNKLKIVHTFFSLFIVILGFSPLKSLAQADSSVNNSPTTEIDLLIEYATEEATKLKQEDEHEAAITLLAEALNIQQEYSNSFNDFLAIAQFYQSRENYSEAERLYIRALTNVNQFIADAGEQINLKAGEVEKRISEQYQQLETISSDPQRLQLLDNRIQELADAISSGKFRETTLNPQQIQRLKESQQQLEDFRDLAQNSQALEARLNELQTQLKEQKLIREREIKNVAVNYIAIVVNDIASIYEAQNEAEKTDLLLSQTLNLLSVNNPELSNVMIRLANFYQSQNKTQAARDLRLQATQLP